MFKVKPLIRTKEIVSKNKNYTEVELKEFSILYLIIENLKIFEKRIETLSDLKLHTPLCKDFLKEIINYILDQNADVSKFQEHKLIKKQYMNFIDQIQNLAPIKYILNSKTDDLNILSMYEEMVIELNKFDIDRKIDLLEKKLIKNMNEDNFRELLELKKQVKRA